MRVVKSDFIPDRSRPGKKTTGLDSKGHWWTCYLDAKKMWSVEEGRRKNEERKKAKKIKLRVATLNVGTIRKRSDGSYGTKRSGHTVCAGNSLEGERARCIGGKYTVKCGTVEVETKRMV